jgi:uncharacterized protein (TIGR02246 family)
MLRHRRDPTRAVRCARALATAILAGGCAHPSVAPMSGSGGEEAGAIAEIAAANTEYARALERGDAPAMAALFTDDGEIIPATQRGAVSGRAAIEAYHAQRLAGRRYADVSITTSELGVSGDLAWEWGTTRLTVRQGEGAPVTLTGRYLAVWRRGADRRWRIRAELPVPDPVP